VPTRARWSPPCGTAPTTRPYGGAFGVVREAEAHDLTLQFLDRGGKPVNAPLTEILAYFGKYWPRT
jgi:hypothetical protein